jgi:quercetin dioxygenase-like cupin family protein
MKKLFLLLTFISLITACREQAGSSNDKKDKAANDSNDVKNSKLMKDNIDPVTIMPDKFKVLLENQYVRVVEYTLKPGEKDEWHTHPAKACYVVSGGKLKVHLENGEIKDFEDKAGTATWMDYVGIHFVENTGNTTVIIVYTEIKGLQ